MSKQKRMITLDGEFRMWSNKNLVERGKKTFGWANFFFFFWNINSKSIVNCKNYKTKQYGNINWCHFSFFLSLASSIGSMFKKYSNNGPSWLNVWAHRTMLFLKTYLGGGLSPSNQTVGSLLIPPGW